MLFAQILVRVGTILYYSHVGNTYLLRGEVLTHRPSLTPPLCIEVVICHSMKLSAPVYMCASGIDCASVSTIL
jgi:hypothetical protein